MQFENVIQNCLLVGVDALFLFISYKTYKKYSSSLKALTEAKILELDGDLENTVLKSGGIIPYAAVFGKVKAVGSPLRSEFDTSASGVIQEIIIKEHKVKYIPWMHIWNVSADNFLKRKLNSVPFCLYSKLGLFKKVAQVEITDPFKAVDLPLTEVGQAFQPSDVTLGNAFVSILLKEHTFGQQTIENMLLEETPLTVVGKIVMENDKLKMSPPGGELLYYVTPMSYNSLVEHTQMLTKAFKYHTIFWFGLSACLCAYFLAKSYHRLRRIINDIRDKKKRLEARRLNRTPNSTQSDNNPKCVICLEYPVEIIVLECGHACLCLNCMDSAGLDLCPVCRSHVSRLVPVFLP